MISIFGIISIMIVMISVAAMVIHNRVMKKRTPVDTHLAELEDLVRDRVEMLYRCSRPGSELRALCDQYIDLDFESIQKALPDIGMAFDDAWEAGNLITDAPFKEDSASAADHNITIATLDNNAQAIQETTAALNQAIDSYNDFITNRPHDILMAHVLGLTTVEPL